MLVQPREKAKCLIRFVDTLGNIRFGEQPASNGSKIARLIANEDPFGSLEITTETAEIRQLLSPIVPTAILGVGLNYRKHAEETNMPIPQHPVLFLKTTNTLQHPKLPIVLPRIAQDEVDYECELAVVIGKTCRNVSVENALDYVLGYTAANDISARRWQGKKGGGQWCRAKCFDTFCPLGPMLVTKELIPDPQNLRISTKLNGETMQSSNTSDMIFSVKELISRLSQDTTIRAGTVIITGTPEGVGFTRKPAVFLKPGDKVVIEIEKIGKLENPVHLASSL